MSEGFELRSPVEYENKWLRIWEERRLFEADPIKGNPKFFICVPYSYQNGPLHLGHAFTFTRGDAVARFKRMQGYNVMFPWAWHWTGEAVAGTCDRLKRGDQAVIRMLKELEGIPDDLLQRFTDPVFVCEHYTKENREVVKRIGFSVDWRREFYTTDHHPYYSNFIRWQYIRLRDRGYVIKGKHPVVWCRNCQSPTGDHDRLIGEGLVPEEYTLVFFEMDGVYLAAGTLRPETIFGTTNVWLNPLVDYVLVEFEGKKVIVSRQAAEKLMEQKEVLRVLADVDPRGLIGKECKVPIVNRSVPILPARFVDPNIVSGVVYSVPAHAPYDYVGLLELPGLMGELGLDPSAYTDILPISIIKLEGYGDFPAVEIVKRMGIRRSTDIRLEDATHEIYMKEFNEGVMRECCDRFSGLPVKVARDSVKAELTSMGMGSIMYDIPGKVVCRCGNDCVVKVVKDQWFLKYSDEEWKRLVREHITTMEIFPEEARQWFLNVVDWLRDWACVRKTGLGTPLPWDDSWMVETLSDSTIYPALYTISKYLNLGIVRPEQLTLSVLDYVFLGVGDEVSISRETGIPLSVLREMREEFLYWYPVDCRISAKELVPNHLTFYIFHHVTLFPRELWPRCIGANGMITIEGEKMSKSKGNVIPIKRAIARYGADATRCTLLLAAEDLDDPDWREKNAEELKKMLENTLSIVRDISSAPPEESDAELDGWLISRLNRHVLAITQAMDRLKTRTACHEAIYGMYKDWRWYVRRGGKNSRAARMFVEAWVRLIAPFAPFMAEEAWSILGKEGFASKSGWPRYDEGKVSDFLEAREELIVSIMEDIREIISVSGKAPKFVYVYVSSEWKLRLLEIILSIGIKETMKNAGTVLKEAVKVFPDKSKELPSVAKRLVENLSSLSHGMSSDIITRLAMEERKIYESAMDFLSSEFGCKLHVYGEDDEGIYDPMRKARNSIPLKPGIYIEFYDGS